MEYALEVVDVTKTFGSLRAVDHISFSIRKGEIMSLLGPSGCGKTTALRIIAGFEHPDAGVVRIAGRNVGRDRPYERNVGLLFQHYALFPHMTVEENVAYGLRHRGWGRNQIGPRVKEMLELVRLSGLGYKRSTQLSGGQQQRVALARAFATAPQLILLDEPLSALDAKLRQELQIELKQILRKVGATVIVVTHDQDEAMSLAERIIVMQNGRIQQDGTPDEIYSKPVNKFVAEFIGRSNWFSSQLQKGPEGCSIVDFDGFQIRVPASGVAIGQGVEVCIRPERMEVLVGCRLENRTDENLITGTLTEIISLGANRHFLVCLPSGKRFEVIGPNRTHPAIVPGQQVTLRFFARDCLVFPL